MYKRFGICILLVGLSAAGCKKTAKTSVIEIPDAHGIQNNCPVRYKGMGVGKLEDLRIVGSSVFGTIEWDDGFELGTNRIVNARAMGILGPLEIEVLDVPAAHARPPHDTLLLFALDSPPPARYRQWTDSLNSVLQQLLDSRQSQSQHPGKP